MVIGVFCALVFPRTDNGYGWYSLFPLIQHLHMMVKLLRLDSKLQDLRRKKIFDFDKQCSHQGICLKVAKMLHCVMGKIILAGSFSHSLYVCFFMRLYMFYNTINTLLVTKYMYCLPYLY